MRTRGRIRPGKGVSAMGAVVGVGMIVFILSSGALEGAPGGFGALFILVALGGVAASIYNAVSDKGIAEELVDFETEPSGIMGVDDEEQTPEERLRSLDGLRRDGLITEEEFAAKREQIVSEL